MWYSAGIGAMHDGLGYATSPDGLNWTRDAGNPIFHKDDTGYPNYPWRQNRSYTPMVLRAGTLRPAWYSGEDGGGKTIGVAYASAEVPTPEEEEFVPEAGSLILLGGGLLTLAGYAGVGYRKR